MHAATVRRSHRHNAFTLTELLIALAVIAILAAALFPVFAQARDYRKVSCLSNERQLSEASSMYALDHAGRVARMSNNLLPYVKGGHSFDGFACPIVGGIRPLAGSNLVYHGGYVETTPAVYLVFWGSQWRNDPSGEAAILQNFFSNVGGSKWANTDTQYTSNYGNAGNQTGELKGVWSDNASNAPKHPTQSQLAGEATRAASHFGSSSYNAQYVICTAHGNNAGGFGSQYCAWHSSTGNIAYTNLPYITDAGASCGANFNGLGATAGITIVAGHEYAETVTDPYPSSGWTDSGGSEIGDKCAWASSTSDQPFGNNSFPVQPLWSNQSGGCVLSGP